MKLNNLFPYIPSKMKKLLVFIFIITIKLNAQSYGYSVDIDPPFRDIDPLKDFGGFKRTILLTKLHFFS